MNHTFKVLKNHDNKKYILKHKSKQELQSN